MQKKIQLILLGFSILIGICLLHFSNSSASYSDYLIDREKADIIMAERTQVDNLCNTLQFNEENLFFDQSSYTFYYSLQQGDSGAYNPRIKVTGNDSQTQIAFLEESITAQNIENNRTIDFLVYTDSSYCQYHLKCTTLPLMNITCEEEIGEEIPSSMKLTLFDNRQNATAKVTTTTGSIKIRGGSSRLYPKKNYRISLTKNSLGNNLRPNDVSLLGMRQDDDWVLYSPYNDPDKVRNVFSTNLWEYTCATDNDTNTNTGTEYKYLELFINGEYCGLYALGFLIDDKQLQIDSTDGEQALFKKFVWCNESLFAQCVNTLPVTGYEYKGQEPAEKAWELLRRYYQTLYLCQNDNQKLYDGVDIDNAIDTYLFVNMIQGVDNVNFSDIENMYLAVMKQGNSLKGLYCPWDMDQSWGMSYNGDLAHNLTTVGILQPEDNSVMESGYLNQLIVNEDETVWNLILDKYQKLRKNLWTEEVFDAMLDSYEADIFASGAYLREKERWPEGNYTEDTYRLDDFRAYVKQRLAETDSYYERLAALENKSVFLVRAAQYPDFYDCDFVLEVRNKELILGSDYQDLFSALGINTDEISETVSFVHANPKTGTVEYLQTLDDSLDWYYNATQYTTYPKENTLVFTNGKRTRLFDFSTDFVFMDLIDYLKSLYLTDYIILIETADTDIWKDSAYTELFSHWGLTEEQFTPETDCILLSGSDNTGYAFRNFRVSGSQEDTPLGVFRYFEDGAGSYGIYCNGEQYYLSQLEDLDMRIILFERDDEGIHVADTIAFDYQLGDFGIEITNCRKPLTDI